MSVRSESELCLEAVELFVKAYGASPTAAAFAPGRIEVLGNHTDYNGGYIMSAAIDKGAIVLGANRGGDSLLGEIILFLWRGKTASALPEQAVAKAAI